MGIPRTPGRNRRTGLAGLLTVALASTGMALAAPVQAAAPASLPNPAQGHPYRHGAVPVNSRQHAATPSTTGTAAATNSNLSYGGGVDNIGVTTGHEKVYVVFWGSQWGTAGTDSNGYTTLSGDPSGEAPRVQALFKGLGTNNETWSGVMTQYCEGIATGAQSCPSTAAHVAYPTNGSLSGVWVDESAAAPGQATGNQLANEAIKAAGHFGNTTASANRDAQYIILSPTGTHPDGFNTSSGNFCAWHDWNGDTTLSGGAATSNYGDIAFANDPYVTDAGTSCGQNYVNSGSAGTLDGVTMVFGHEYAELITDQNPAGGWTDSSGQENADKCAWNGTGGTGGAQNVSFATGSFAMQATWSNDGASGAGACEISHPIVGGGGSANTVSVTNPGNQSGTVGTATSLQINASDSSSSATLTYSASGLPAGLSINSSTGLISGTPTTAGTSSVTVTATDNTGASGSTTFSWAIASSSTGCTATQLLGNPGFETGSASPWSATSGVINNSTSEPAHSGSWDAWLDGYGTTHTDTLSQQVTIPAGCTANFSFWLHIDTAETTTTTAYDTLTVKANSTTLATYSNLDAAGGYVQKSFDLSSFAGQTVTLTFTGSEDSSLQTSFVIDDTALNVS